jgi:hypothetical protein
MAIVLGRRIPRWPTPVFYAGLAQGLKGVSAGQMVMPGFSNDDNAGSAITIGHDRWGQNSNGYLRYYAHTGAQITSGSWSGALTPAVFGATYWMGFYMDETDALLYVWHWTNGSGMGLTTINKAGQLVNIGAKINAPTSINQYWASGFHRTVDGSGSFYGYVSNANLNGNASAAVPYRGVRIEIHPTTGAHTYSYATPAPGSLISRQSISQYAMIGPTSNNIILGFPGSASTNDFGGSHSYMINLTTGNEIANYLPTFENSLGLPRSSGTTWSPISRRWRGNYVFHNENGDNAGGRLFPITQMHEYVDEIAREVGIL